MPGVVPEDGNLFGKSPVLYAELLQFLRVTASAARTLSQ
jgi:hypothetical protein